MDVHAVTTLEEETARDALIEFHQNRAAELRAEVHAEKTAQIILNYIPRINILLSGERAATERSDKAHFSVASANLIEHLDKARKDLGYHLSKTSSEYRWCLPSLVNQANVATYGDLT